MRKVTPGGNVLAELEQEEVKKTSRKLLFVNYVI